MKDISIDGKVFYTIKTEVFSEIEPSPEFLEVPSQLINFLLFKQKEPSLIRFKERTYILPQQVQGNLGVVRNMYIKEGTVHLNEAAAIKLKEDASLHPHILTIAKQGTYNTQLLAVIPLNVINSLHEYFVNYAQCMPIVVNNELKNVSFYTGNMQRAADPELIFQLNYSEIPDSGFTFISANAKSDSLIFKGFSLTDLKTSEKMPAPFCNLFLGNYKNSEIRSNYVLEIPIELINNKSIGTNEDIKNHEFSLYEPTLETKISDKFVYVDYNSTTVNQLNRSNFKLNKNEGAFLRLFQKKHGSYSHSEYVYLGSFQKGKEETLSYRDAKQTLSDKATKHLFNSVRFLEVSPSGSTRKQTSRVKKIPDSVINHHLRLYQLAQKALDSSVLESSLRHSWHQIPESDYNKIIQLIKRQEMGEILLDEIPAFPPQLSVMQNYLNTWSMQIATPIQYESNLSVKHFRNHFIKPVIYQDDLAVESFQPHLNDFIKSGLSYRTKVTDLLTCISFLKSHDQLNKMLEQALLNNGFSMHEVVDLLHS